MSEQIASQANHVTNSLLCNVCTQPLYRPYTLLCQHTFCSTCIHSAKDKKCPICRCPYVIPRDYNHLIDDVAKLFYREDWTQLDEEYQAVLKQKREAQDIREELRKEMFAAVAGEVVEATVTMTAATNRTNIADLFVSSEQIVKENMSKYALTILTNYNIIEYYGSITRLIFYMLVMSTVGVISHVSTAILTTVLVLDLALNIIIKWILKEVHRMEEKNNDTSEPILIWPHSLAAN